NFDCVITMQWHYLRLVPEKFHRKSGIATHRFSVHDAWHRPYKHIRTTGGGVSRIPESAYCLLHHRQGSDHILIPIPQAPELFEAVILMGKLHFSSARVEKYMNLFKSYECLVGNPDMRFAAVRHGLSHPDSALTRPKTVQALKSLFGTTRIDLESHTHV